MDDTLFSPRMSDNMLFKTDHITRTSRFFNRKGEIPIYLMYSANYKVSFFEYSHAIWSSTLRMREAFRLSPYPVSTRYNGLSWITAKGLIIRSTTEGLIPYIIETCDGLQPGWEKQRTLYVKKDLNEIPPDLLDAVEQRVKDFEGTVHKAVSIESYFGVKAEIPKFGNLQQRKAFLDGIVDDTIASILK